MNFIKKWKKEDNHYDDEPFIDEDYYGTQKNDEQFFDEEPTLDDEATKASSGVSFFGSGAPVSLKVVRPKNYDEGPEIADYLLSGSTVLLNAEQLDKNSTKRLLDFLLGATHVLGGTMNMVAKGTFVFAPKSVGVSDSADDEIEEESEAQDSGVIIDD